VRRRESKSERQRDCEKYIGRERERERERERKKERETLARPDQNQRDST